LLYIDNLIILEVKMRFYTFAGSFVLVSIILLGCVTPKGNTVNDKRTYVLDMKNETLTELCSKRPEVKSKISRAAGYAVFSNINTNLFLFSSGNGYGVAIDGANGKKTYMKMNFVGIGPGIGVKDFKAVLIFKNQETFNEFVDGEWEFGGHADAAAKSGEKGAAAAGEMYIEDDIEVYQMTEAGVALQATVAGTYFRQYAGLN
jgi:lipid-binding SYLF domain-containing protein